MPFLAAAVANAIGAELAWVVDRRRPMSPLRDVPTATRPAFVGSAGYEVVARVFGRRVVLVDDVVLTGTTLEFLAGLLIDAGAVEVSALVACRTRRA